MKNYLKLLHFLKGHRRLFALAVTLMIISSFFEGFQLSLLVPLTDRVFNKKDIVIPNELPEPVVGVVDWLNSISPETMFWAMPFAVIALLTIKQSLIFSYSYFMNDVSQRVMRDVPRSIVFKNTKPFIGLL